MILHNMPAAFSESQLTRVLLDVEENPKRRTPYCDFSFVPKSLQKQPYYANRTWEEPGSATAGILVEVQS